MLTLAVFAVSATLLILTPAPAIAADPIDDLLVLTNQSRAAAGLPPLAIYWDLADDAQAHAELMAEQGLLFHNSNLAGVTTGWSALGENVGLGETAPAIHEGFLDSDAHRAHIFGDFNYVGIGVSSDASRIYVGMIFMKGPSGLVSGAFWDDDTSVHQADIELAWAKGITQGCAPGRYCPDAPVTRGQMAAFLVRALELPSSDKDHFTDDDGTVFEADINALATAGITSGCGPERYCPDGVITRAEMAAFLSRASSLPPSAQNYFSDDDGSIFEPDINTVAAAEITEGCGQSFYCPHDYVTRAQMASFLVRAIP